MYGDAAALFVSFLHVQYLCQSFCNFNEIECCFLREEFFKPQDRRYCLVWDLLQ